MDRMWVLVFAILVCWEVSIAQKTKINNEELKPVLKPDPAGPNLSRQPGGRRGGWGGWRSKRAMPEEEEEDDFRGMFG
uniref:Uncharacterized protein n=1 Tax=Ciona intestinalis TaxID=7719 RepID=H2XMH1_CIOIN